ncbi:MAG TPA: 16S rRNA (cytosine(967)-C(5))-methyltransferase RsmB [Verrucomicrobiales bacterium]|nr:16S rRNA (cytosine(967)-C(5))-methyltransferase RsmB [Verrucomicrobiales bacterium]
MGLDSSRVPRQIPREIAARVLRQWEESPVTAEALLAEALPALRGPDRGLCQELVLGVIRRRATLDWLIDQKTDGRRQQPLARVLLRLGLYQLFFLDRVPDHAALHETVNLAHRHDLGKQAGFINAVLRSAQREKDDWLARLAELRTSQPAIGHSHPQWLVQRWADRWPDHDTLLEWNNRPAPIFARRNTLRATAEELEAQWTAEGASFEPAEQSWLSPGLMYRLETNGSPAALPSFAEGKFYLQDASTLASVQELDPRSGENILDLCAAPGGKSTAIAQRMQDTGAILAVDIDERRLDRLRENAGRLGHTCIQPKLLSEIDLKTAGPFDRILIDAPCSNTGVMRRRVDVRWRLQARELPSLARKQLELLRIAASRLKPGGVMVYSTCSLEAEENEGVVETFLKKARNYSCETQRTLTPMSDGVDGAFVARLRKESTAS